MTPGASPARGAERCSDSIHAWSPNDLQATIAEGVGRQLQSASGGRFAFRLPTRARSGGNVHVRMHPRMRSNTACACGQASAERRARHARSLGLGHQGVPGRPAGPSSGARSPTTRVRPAPGWTGCMTLPLRGACSGNHGNQCCNRCGSMGCMSCAPCCACRRGAGSCSAMALLVRAVMRAARAPPSKGRADGRSRSAAHRLAGPRRPSRLARPPATDSN